MGWPRLEIGVSYLSDNCREVRPSKFEYLKDYARLTAHGVYENSVKPMTAKEWRSVLQSDDPDELACADSGSRFVRLKAHNANLILAKGLSEAWQSTSEEWPKEQLRLKSSASGNTQKEKERKPRKEITEKDVG